MFIRCNCRIYAGADDATGEFKHMERGEVHEVSEKMGARLRQTWPKDFSVATEDEFKKFEAKRQEVAAAREREADKRMKESEERAQKHKAKSVLASAAAADGDDDD